MFKYYLYRIGLFIIYRLPFKLSYRFAVMLCDLHYFFSFRDRRAVRNNLNIICPDDKDVGRKVRQVFQNFGKYLVEFFCMRRMVNKTFIKEKVNIQGLERLDEVLSKGKGGILLTAHLGNWELGAVLVATMGYPVTAVALPHKERPVNDLFNTQRESKGIVVVPSVSAVKQCLQALRKNQIVALVGDRDFSLNGEVVDFLGRKAFIPKGAAVFAERTGAAIIPAFLTRGEDDRFFLSLEPPIFPEKNNGRASSEVVLKLMRQYLNILEKRIQENPTQWLMFREFWADENKCAYSCS